MQNSIEKKDLCYFLNQIFTIHFFPRIIKSLLTETEIESVIKS